MSRLGFGPLLGDAPVDLPGIAAAQQHAIQASSANYDAARDEVSLYCQSFEQAQALTRWTTLPWSS